MRFRHYSIRTEQTYLNWVKRFGIFQKMKHPRKMGIPEIEAFLSHLASEEKIGRSPQNRAFNALLFSLQGDFADPPLGARRPLDTL